MTSWFEKLREQDDAAPRGYFTDPSPGMLGEAMRGRHHARLALEQMREALRHALKIIDCYEYEGRIIKSCGACGTPVGACDGDCVTAAYISRDKHEAEKALALLDAPEPPREQE